jgi:hypothetical protein
VISRAVMSDAPPAGKGTITVMLRSGYSAAWTEAAEIAARAKSARVQQVGSLIGASLRWGIVELIARTLRLR